MFRKKDKLYKGKFSPERIVIFMDGLHIAVLMILFIGLLDINGVFAKKNHLL